MYIYVHIICIRRYFMGLEPFILDMYLYVLETAFSKRQQSLLS